MRNTVQKILQHDKCFTLQGEGLPKGSEKMLQRERFFLGEGIQPLRVFAVFAFGFSLIILSVLSQQLLPS